MVNGYAELKVAFQKVRKALGYPPLRLPVFVDSKGTACISFDKDYHEIEISTPFLEELVKKGLLLDTALEGILKHEVNHYSKHPYDCKTILKEMLWLDKYGEKKNAIRLHYDDVIDNLDLIVNKGDVSIPQLYQHMDHRNSQMMQLMMVYYQEVTGCHFGVEKKNLPQNLQEKVMQLKRIDFLDTSHMKANILRFAFIVHDIKDMDPPPMAEYEISEMDVQDLEHAIKQVAKEHDISQEDFRKLLKMVEKELNKNQKAVGEGRKEFLIKLQKANIFYYESLAQKYTLSIKKFLHLKGGGMFPTELRQFEFDDDVASYDPFNSYGKLAPDPKKWVYDDFTSFGSKEKVPNALLILDSSGSMPNPSETLSYAVLACFCAANAYLMNGSKVGVVNFSNTNLSVPFTEDTVKIYEMLASYQSGGTTLHIPDLEKVVATSSDKIDITFVTDAGISNFEEVVKYVDGIKNINRVTFIRLKDNFAEGDKNFTAMKKHYGKTISFHEVEKQEDILPIILGNVGW